MEQWESMADLHTSGMFGPIRSKVESNVSAAQERWNQVVKVRRRALLGTRRRRSPPVAAGAGRSEAWNLIRRKLV